MVQSNCREEVIEIEMSSTIFGVEPTLFFLFYMYSSVFYFLPTHQ